MDSPTSAHSIRPNPQQNEMSIAVLNAISETPLLSAKAAQEWVSQLDNAILSTKNAIHERIQTNKSAFEHQLETSRDVQRRFQLYTTNVGSLKITLEDPESGLVPVILRKLREHGDLAQRTLDTDIANQNLQHLLQCKKEYERVVSLLQDGRIPEALIGSEILHGLVDKCPSPLEKSRVLQELRSLSRALGDRIREQLFRAYAECIQLDASNFVVRHQYTPHLTLSSIFISLPQPTLLSYLASLRKDILALYIEPVLNGEASLIPDGAALRVKESKSSDTISSLHSLFIFISKQLIPHIPEKNRAGFMSSLYIPTTESIQAKLLIPSIPDSLGGIPSHLRLLRETEELESKMAALGFLAGAELRIKSWVQNAHNHYERKRRASLLEQARTIVLGNNHHLVPVSIQVSTSEVVDLTGAEEKSVEMLVDGDMAAWGFEDEESKSEDKVFDANEDPEDAWGFDEEEPNKDVDEDDPWGTGFDDPPSPKNVESKPIKVLSSTKDESTGPKLEEYLVSSAAVAISRLVSDILQESNGLLRSSIFHDLGFPTPTASLLLSSSPASFDLYRAFPPTSNVTETKRGFLRSLEYSNDCKYLSLEAKQIAQGRGMKTIPDSLKKQFEGVADHFEVIGQSWFDDSVEYETQQIKQSLSRLNGFRDIGHDPKFSEALDIVNDAKDRINALATDLKIPLTTTICYTTLGKIIDEVINKILEDVLALQDIPELESRRLAELCQILHPLDGLFPEIHNGVSTVATYAFLWLKFTWLSDILEGSITDISEWFDAGHLVDYDAQELCRLILALFSQTRLRDSTIAKISAAG